MVASKKERGVGEERGTSYCLGPLATWYPGVCWNNILSTGSKSEKFVEVSKSADFRECLYKRVRD